MISTNPQEWAYVLDRVFEDTHEHWMWRLRFANRLIEIADQHREIDRLMTERSRPRIYVTP